MDTDAADDLDPELAMIVEEWRARGVPEWHSLSVESARRLEDELFSSGSGPELSTVRDLSIPGPDSDLPIRVYRPDAENPPTIVFFHGGGWVLGTLDSADDICRELAERTDSLVIAVDYRLAPEHPFPAAIDDAYTAVCWAADHADALGGDSTRLAVAGTSAGGNLAAATALRCRDGGPALDGQFLFYPITDAALDTDSALNGRSPLLSRSDMRWFWEQYCRSPVDRHSPFASVLRAPDPSAAAPAVVATAGFDVLRDEGADYAAHLDEHGVETIHEHYPTLTHGFLSLTDGVGRADDAFDELAAAAHDLLI